MNEFLKQVKDNANIVWTKAFQTGSIELSYSLVYIDNILPAEGITI